MSNLGRRWKLSAALVAASVTMCAPVWGPFGGGGSTFDPTTTPFMVAHYCGLNIITADITSGYMLGAAECPLIAVAQALGTTSEQLYSVIASPSSAHKATPLRLSCWFGNDTSSGTLLISLVVLEDANDITVETIGTISVNLATDDDIILTTTSFSAITSTPPYFFAVQLADGGSVSTNGGNDAICDVTWLIEAS